MGTTKTLGGDRLGAGKKQQVEITGYERSTHDLSCIFRTTMSAGPLVPCLVEVALPGDTFEIEYEAEVLTHPTEGPLFGSYKLQIDTFSAPMRLYIGVLHNNKLKVGLNMASVKMPLMRLLAIDVPADTEDVDNAQINPSCIFKYLGISGVGMVNTGTPGDTGVRTFNAIPWLFYWDSYKNYYANKQEELGAVIHSPAPTIDQWVDTVSIFQSQSGLDEALSQAPAVSNLELNEDSALITITQAIGTPDYKDVIFNTSIGPKSVQQLAKTINVVALNHFITYDVEKWGRIYVTNWRYATPAELPPIAPVVQLFDLNKLDDMREYLLVQTGPSAVIINDADLEPFNYMVQAVYGPGAAVSQGNTQEGLALKTYQSDLFNNWVKTEYIDGPGGITEMSAVAIDITTNSFTIDQLNLAKKVYDYLNKIAVSGGSYNDWLEVTYDNGRLPIVETPIYHGGLSKEVIFQQVISNTPTEGKPLGTIAGRGTLAQKHKGGHVTMKFSEPSFIMAIVSLTPRIDYSQGNAWHTHIETMDDLHKPAFDGIGFQELITEQMAWWDTTQNVLAGPWITKSAGKQPAWVNYMTNFNKVYGNFAIPNNEMFMTLNRRYEREAGTIKDLTTYIDPAKYNSIFAETSIDAMNFWVQIGMKITARRKMSGKLMPNV